MIVRVNVVLNRTVSVDSDWRFDNLCRSHLQSQRDYHYSLWQVTPLCILGQHRILRHHLQNLTLCTCNDKLCTFLQQNYWPQQFIIFFVQTGVSEDELFLFLKNCWKWQMPESNLTTKKLNSKGKFFFFNKEWKIKII